MVLRIKLRTYFCVKPLKVNIFTYLLKKNIGFHHLQTNGGKTPFKLTLALIMLTCVFIFHIVLIGYKFKQKIYLRKNDFFKINETT